MFDEHAGTDPIDGEQNENCFWKKKKPHTLRLVFFNQVVLILKLSVCTHCLLFHIWIKPWLCKELPFYLAYLQAVQSKDFQILH